MGQGGFITITNGTNQNWRKIVQHSYQMNTWNFPETITAGTAQSVYVEWDQGPGKNQKDDAGEVFYVVEGTNDQFEIQARNHGRFDLRVIYHGMNPAGASPNQVYSLGWYHNGTVSFILAGKPGQYIGTGSPCDYWMDMQNSLIGNLTLREISIPGSHDAGMSVFNGGTFGARPCNTITQSHSIGGQLALGTRYFDIRPVISGGQFKTGHYNRIEKSGIVSWQGANGQSIDSIIDEVNNFTASGKKELVVLSLSKSLNTDVGNSSYRQFTDQEWTTLLEKMTQLNCRYTLNNPGDTDLTYKQLNDFVGDGPCVIVIVNGYIHPELIGKGFFPTKNFMVYDEYSSTNNFDQMANDQLNKMRAQSGKYFLLSWTLTQSDLQASTCFLGTASSIHDLANRANRDLVAWVFPRINLGEIPNIIYTDYIETTVPALLSVASNWSQCFKSLVVGFRASNDKYVQARDGGNSPLQAIADHLWAWEQFTLIFLQPLITEKGLIPRVAIRACNGKFVCNENNGENWLIANRTAIGIWETFELQYFQDIGKFALRASNQLFVSNEDNGGRPLKADRDMVGDWERFSIEIVSATAAAIKRMTSSSESEFSHFNSGAETTLMQAE